MRFKNVNRSAGEVGSSVNIGLDNCTDNNNNLFAAFGSSSGGTNNLGETNGSLNVNLTNPGGEDTEEIFGQCVDQHRGSSGGQILIFKSHIST